jgi:hypothetical protein
MRRYHILFDVEHDKLTIKKPDVITFSEILTKHTFETWNVLRESVKHYRNKKVTKKMMKSLTQELYRNSTND